MRVLFTSVSGLGHVHPMIPLALAFRDRGHDVRWATGPDACPRLESVGIKASPVGEPFEQLRGETFRRFPELRQLPPETLGQHIFPRLFGEVATESTMEGILEIARAWRPALVVHDAAEFAGPVAAAALAVPNVSHGFGTLTPRERVAEASALVAPLWRSAGLDPRPFGGMYDHLYLDIYPPGLRRDDRSHIRRIQPLRPIPFDDTGTDGSYEQPDGARSPLVYVSFGTVDRGIAALRTAVAAIAALDVRVLATVGPRRAPADLGTQPANVRVERYVPQTQVLRHAAVVATHGGSGTFLAALALGIPQLCLPQGADQFLNADACTQAGIGLVLRPADAGPDAIASAVDRLLKESTFRARASEFASTIETMPGPDDVVPILERLAS